MRIASLLPSATEIVYALGLDDRLVAVTHECDEPASAREKHAVVVRGLDTRGLTPAEIDRRVRAALAAGHDVAALEAGVLAGLAPDLVLTQDLCQVCAVPAGQVERALEHLGTRAAVLTLDPHSLDDVLAGIAEVGRAAGADARAAEVVAALRERLRRVAVQVGGRPRPRVLVLEWVDPPYTAGHWVPDLVLAAGGEPVGRGAGHRSRAVGWDAVRAAAPDVVVVAPCGFHLPAAAEQARAVLDRLPPVPVWAIDADGLVVRPGPRLVTGVEALAGVLHPDVAGPADPAAVTLVRG